MSLINDLAKEHCLRIFRDRFGIHSEEALAPILASCRLASYEKDEIIYREGDMMNECVFLVSGSFYFYVKDEKSREVVVCISDEYGEPAIPFACLEDFSKPLFLYLAAPEKMTVLFVPTDAMIHLATTNEEAMATLVAMVRKWNAIHSKMAIYNSYSIAERYDIYREWYPNLFARLPRNTIARLLNVSPAALSRALNN